MTRIWIALLCSAAAFGADAAQTTDAIQRAVKVMLASQEVWYAKQTCNSCHHQYQPAIAYGKLSGRVLFAAYDGHFPEKDTDLDRAVQYSYVIEPAMDDAYRLVAQSFGGFPNLVSQVYARLIAARQYPDGHWESFHQRPPASYSRFTQTALALRAIQGASHPSRKADVQAQVAKARAWLLANEPPDVEGRTYQLLGLLWSGGNTSDVRQRLGQELLATQQKDGGWSSLDGAASDAYATGEALVALHDAAGMANSNPAWQHGIGFLLKAQAADGSWHVASRLHPPAAVSPPYFDSGYPGGHDQFISMQASSWAIMALAETLPPPLGGPDFIDAHPFDFEPWAETILFGSVADTKKLLDGGFDPNAATKGGTTALMMAAPDVEKMKLLMDHGARVNARAKSGYTALMVACQYRDADNAIELLLSRGAEVKAAEPTLFNASPFFLAAYAGNAASLKRLKDAGGDVEAPMDLIGTSRTTPLMGAVRFGDIPVATELIDLGAKVDSPDGSGVTALDRAVLGNQVEMAKLLIVQGADVNHVDKLGMTPLLYAASIDFGDSAVIDVLLKAGARRDAKSKEGLTALELARKYQPTHLSESLKPQ
jgi:ankyrin repeat protein